MKKIAFFCLVSIALALGVTACHKDGGDHPKADHPKSENSKPEQSKPEHPEHPK